MRKKEIKNLLKPLRWIFAVVIVGYVVYYLTTHREQLASLKQLTPMTLLLLALLNLMNTYIFGIRLRMVVHKKSGVSIPMWAWLKFFVVSRFLGLYAGQAGNLYRAAVLKSRYQISLTKYISSFVFITWIDTCLGFIFALVVIGLFAPSMTLFGINAILMIFGLIVVLFILPLGLEKIVSHLHFSVKPLDWLQRRLSEMAKTVLASLGDRRFVANISAVEVLSFIVSILVIHLCFRGLGFEIDPGGAVLFFVIMKVCNRLIITPGNIGVREFAYGIISEQLNLGMAQGILASVVIRMITLLVTSALGLAAGGYEFIKHPLESTDNPDNDQFTRSGPQA